MRSILRASMLGIMGLGWMAAWPCEASARPPFGFGAIPGPPVGFGARPPLGFGWRGGGYGWHAGPWGGQFAYGFRPIYRPSAFYYQPYAYSYSPYGYYGSPYGYSTGYASYPTADYSVSSYDSDPRAALNAWSSAAAALPHPTGSGAVAPPDAGLIRLRIPDPFADITFNGQAASSTGTMRDFVTPTIPPGQTYQYTITASWGRGEQQTTRQQTIDIARGQIRTVDFSALDAPGAFRSDR